jgi:hypothetical protein
MKKLEQCPFCGEGDEDQVCSWTYSFCGTCRHDDGRVEQSLICKRICALMAENLELALRIDYSWHEMKKEEPPTNCLLLLEMVPDEERGKTTFRVGFRSGFENIPYLTLQGRISAER